MIVKVFALRDVKADAYGSPFFLPSDGIARRMLTEWVSDPRSEVAKYSADFHMYELGEFNNESGSFTSREPKFICSALSCVPVPVTPSIPNEVKEVTA